MNVKKWLTEEEYQLYLVHEKHGDGVSALYLTIAKERELSETRRALLDEAQEVLPPECSYLHKAIATALKGVGE